MEFGVLNFYEHPAGQKAEYRVFKEQLETLRAAEDLGFDYIWAPEHHFTQYGFCASPMLTLASLATVTKRVRLGTGVVVLPFHNAIRVAEEGATIDLMSDGRFDLGVGRGFQPIEFAGFGIDQAHSQELFEQALQTIEDAWNGKPLKPEGDHFNANNTVHPRPIQQPRPPIWLAAVNAPSLELAGVRGYNLLGTLVPGFSNPLFADYLQTYRRALCAAGHDPSKKKIGALCMVYCADTTAQARQDFGGPVLWYFRAIEQYLSSPQGSKFAPTYENYEKVKHYAHTIHWDELLNARALICGNPDHCIRQIEDIEREYGITQLISWTRLAGLEHRKVMRSMELFSRHVLPHVRRTGRLEVGGAQAMSK